MSLESVLLIICIGVGATAFMDAWLLLLRRLGVPTLNFAMLGRWAGHLLRGRIAHTSIASSPPVRGELWLGWLVHYLVGIVLAALLVAAQGPAWSQAPTLAPALGFGVISVCAPLFVMQPAMGAGFAAMKTPAPLKNCLRSLANHAIFGLGLYLAACCVAWAIVQGATT